MPERQAVMREQLVTSSAQTYGGISRCTSITVHETANTSVGANARAHANLQSNGNVRQASWQITVDDTEAVRSYPDTARCWHAGPEAADSIALEICVNSDGDYDKAFANAAEEVRKLRIEHGHSRNDIRQHHDWTGKDCPSQMRLTARWQEFLALTDPQENRMINPVVGRVSSEYSRTRKHPVTGRTLPHLGIDIAAAIGTTVVAAFAGKVISVRTGSYRGDARSGAVGGRTGNHVYIQNPDGERQYYGHLSEVNVRDGESVKAGQKIGEVGDTGVVTGPHLHFEIHDASGNTRNPRVDFNHFGVKPGVGGAVIVPTASKPKPAPRPTVKPAPAKPKPASSGNSKADNIAIAKALNAMGYDAGYPDGVDGPKMKGAVKAFQTDFGLHPDSKWGPVTQKKYESLGKNPKRPAQKKTYRNLKRGMTGTDVLAVARALRKLGYTKQGDTSTFTAQLEANVKDWQRRKNLRQDGIAGEITQKSLGL